MQLRYVPLVAAALLASGACTSSPDALYAGVCVDEITQQRVDDSQCGDFDDEGRSSSSGSFFMWISTTSPTHIPAHGQPVVSTIGSRTVPAGTPVAKGLPASGGSMSSVVRGGFGVRAGVSGGSSGG